MPYKTEDEWRYMGRLMCERHGPSALASVTEDVAAAVRSNTQINVIRLDYAIDDAVVDSTFLSDAFAAKHGIVGGQAPLPSEYPSVLRHTTPVCAECLFEFMRRHSNA